MPKPAAIAADFCDFRTVKTRKLVQLILEIPVERAQQALDMLGWPSSDNPIPVALALLNRSGPDGASTPPIPAGNNPSQGQAAKDRYKAMSEGEKAVARAAMLSDDADFAYWAWDKGGRGVHESSAEFIRRICGVESRREIATDPDALKRFLALELEFQQATGKAAKDPRA